MVVSVPERVYIKTLTPQKKEILYIHMYKKTNNTYIKDTFK